MNAFCIHLNEYCCVYVYFLCPCLSLCVVICSWSNDLKIKIRSQFVIDYVIQFNFCFVLTSFIWIIIVLILFRCCFIIYLWFANFSRGLKGHDMTILFCVKCNRIFMNSNYIAENSREYGREKTVILIVFLTNVINANWA